MIQFIIMLGTYVKEFMHGDGGRTTPNLAQILGVGCKVVELDGKINSFDFLKIIFSS